MPTDLPSPQPASPLENPLNTFEGFREALLEHGRKQEAGTLSADLERELPKIFALLQKHQVTISSVNIEIDYFVEPKQIKGFFIKTSLGNNMYMNVWVGLGGNQSFIRVTGIYDEAVLIHGEKQCYGRTTKSFDMEHVTFREGECIQPLSKAIAYVLNFGQKNESTQDKAAAVSEILRNV